MDTCGHCSATISGKYYRDKKEIICVPCGERRVEEMKQAPVANLMRGVLYAFIAACVGFLLRWGFESIFVGMEFLGMLAAFLRFGVFILIVMLISGSAKAGARGRGGVILQAFATLFTYLAITLALAPVILSRMPIHNLQGVVGSVVALLALPFEAVAKNPMALTGLVATIFCMVLAWQSTSDPHEVDGPYDGVGAERPMFKGLG